MRDRPTDRMNQLPTDRPDRTNHRPIESPNERHRPIESTTDRTTDRANHRPTESTNRNRARAVARSSSIKRRRFDALAPVSVVASRDGIGDDVVDDDVDFERDDVADDDESASSEDDDE